MSSAIYSEMILLPSFQSKFPRISVETGAEGAYRIRSGMVWHKFDNIELVPCLLKPAYIMSYARRKKKAVFEERR